MGMIWTGYWGSPNLTKLTQSLLIFQEWFLMQKRQKEQPHTRMCKMKTPSPLGQFPMPLLYMAPLTLMVWKLLRRPYWLAATTTTSRMWIYHKTSLHKELMSTLTMQPLDIRMIQIMRTLVTTHIKTNTVYLIQHMTQLRHILKTRPKTAKLEITPKAVSKLKM